MSKGPVIVLTNDDGILSPGLAAAAEALDPLGTLVIIAPVKQQTSMGRSRYAKFDIESTFSRYTIEYNGKQWNGFAVDASPAVALELGLHGLLSEPPDLVVSGINYGENIGTCVTISGTIGAAMEAADYGIKALAVSLEIISGDYHSYDKDIDFSAAIHFTRLFSQGLLKTEMPEDVDILKAEIPATASEETPWVFTRQDRIMYYKAELIHDNEKGAIPSLQHNPRRGEYRHSGTDAHAMAQGKVSLTPLSLDMTSRVPIEKLKELLMEGIDADEK
jgi:5'-nucleotidase